MIRNFAFGKPEYLNVEDNNLGERSEDIDESKFKNGAVMLSSMLKLSV